MSLIKCDECGKEISDTAKKCPNCGYKIKKRDKTILGSILIITIPTLLIIVGIIIAVLVINNGPKEKNKTPDYPDNFEQEKTNKRNFADIAINYLKAGETAYVGESLYSNLKDTYKYYTIDKLNDKYLSGYDDDYKGCVILEIDEDGDIEDKSIYITDKKYMIYDESIKYILDDYLDAVERYDSDMWEKSYERCEFTE